MYSPVSLSGFFGEWKCVCMRVYVCVCVCVCMCACVSDNQNKKHRKTADCKLETSFWYLLSLSLLSWSGYIFIISAFLSCKSHSKCISLPHSDPLFLSLSLSPSHSLSLSLTPSLSLPLFPSLSLSFPLFLSSPHSLCHSLTFCLFLISSRYFSCKLLYHGNEWCRFN